MKRYTTYKDSGVQWLGEIPSHWEKWKVKHLFHIGRGRVIAQTELTEAGYPVYSSQTLNNGCLGLIPTYDYDCTQLTWTTDGVNAGTVFLREGKHNCTNVCGTLLPKKNDNDIHFLKYALGLTAFFHKRKDTNGYKIMNNEMAEITLFLPPLPEQHAIAAYLDTQTANLDTAIAQQQQLISLLQERKQVIINHAVTRGLDDNVALKNSGVEWIGVVPEHWEVRKLKNYITRSVSGVWGNDNGNIENNIVCFRVADFDYSKGLLKTNNLTIRNIEPKDIKNKQLRYNDLLIEKSGGGDLFPVGRVVRFKEDIKCVCSNFIQAISLNDKLSPDFVYYFLKFSYSLKVNTLYFNQTTGIQNLKVKEFLCSPIFLPPLPEQTAIAAYLDKQCSQIDEAISQAQQQIALLQERKQIIINEVVTGKVKIM